jgi:hypothetical protein
MVSIKEEILAQRYFEFWRFRAVEDFRYFSFSFCQAEVTDRRAVNVREFPWV